MTDSEGSRSRRLSKDARRSQLLDTAGELPLHDGVDQGAGASNTLGYAYFDNVDHVIVAQTTACGGWADPSRSKRGRWERYEGLQLPR